MESPSRKERKGTHMPAKLHHVDQRVTRSARRRGLSLIELLVVITVILVLIAIALPTVSAVRSRSNTTKSVSNLRQHAAAFSAYTTDWAGVLPRFISPDGTHRLDQTTRGTGPFPYPFTDRYPYFAQSVFWPFVIATSGYHDHNWTADFFHPPGVNILDASTQDDLPYQYTATAVSSPAFWQTTTRTGPDQWVAVRIADTRYPASKVLLSTLYQPSRGAQQAHLAFMDASAESRDPARIEPPYPTGEGPFDGRWSPIPGWPIGSHTIAGVHGRDVTSR